MGAEGHPAGGHRARPFPDPRRQEPADAQGARWRRTRCIKAIPLRRVGEHIELAKLAAFLSPIGRLHHRRAVVIDGGKR